MTVTDVLPRDAIPSIDEPTFDSHYFGDGDDEVLVVDGDPARAYPVRILSYHEIVNDTVGERPVAVTWCPICWSGAVYDAAVDGRRLTFGVSGKLADDALVMYDRETDSEWKQPTGEALSGPLAGRRLDALPASTTTVERFRADHPDGLFLQPVRGGQDATDAQLRAIHDMDSYEAYVRGDHFGLHGMRGTGEPRSWDREDLDAKSLVLGVEADDEAVGYPLARVRDAGGVVTDTVGNGAVVVFAVDGELHAFENPGYAFEPVAADGTDNDDARFRADGTVWDGVSGASDDGRQLRRLPAVRQFAFAWQDSRGRDGFYD